MSNQESNLPLEVEHAVMMGEALERLENNPDYKLVIEEGYLKDKVLSSVSLLSVPAIKKSGERPDIFEDIINASGLMYYLHQTRMFYKGATEPQDDVEDEDVVYAEGEPL